MKRPACGLFALCLIHAALLAWSAYRHSPTNDEVAHLPAGLMCWQYRRFDLYPVNPPLVKMLAAAPVAALGPRTDWDSFTVGPGSRPEWTVGRDFLAANGPRSFRYFTLARWALIPLSLIGLCACYAWGRDLYGAPAGLLAATLWCFSPNILANAALITPDAPAAALGVLAGWLFWRWLREPAWPLAFAAGVAFGFAQFTKFTWLILFPLWPLLWLAWRWSARGDEAVASGRSQAAQLALILGLSLFLINAGYEFRGSFTPLGEFTFVSEALAGPELDPPDHQDGRNRFRGAWLASLPVPLPKDYLLGIDLQRVDFETEHPCYLAGEHRQGGWWYYYLYALAVKVPLGTWALALLLPFIRRGPATRRRDTLVLLAPAAAVLLLVSWQHTVAHFRYLLPAFPFAFVAVSRVAQAARLGQPRLALAAGAAVACSVAGSLWVYPHSLSYFNLLAGGPQGGQAHMLGSGLDWGQDLLYLKRWLDAHPEARPLGLAYHGHVDPRLAGIEFSLPPLGVARPGDAEPPAGPRPGWYAVSVHLLRGSPSFAADTDGGVRYLPASALSYFLRFRPVGAAGHSIYVYRVTPEDADRVRKELGPPPTDRKSEHLSLRRERVP